MKDLSAGSFKLFQVLANIELDEKGDELKVNEEKIHWTAEVAKMVDVSPTTIYRWTLALESLDYKILEGSQGRGYRDMDVEVLKRMKEESSNGPRMKTIDLARIALNLNPDEKYVPSPANQTSNPHNTQQEESSLITQGQMRLLEFMESYQEAMNDLEREVTQLKKELRDRPSFEIDKAKAAFQEIGQQIDHKMDIMSKSAQDRSILQIREEQMALWTLEKRVEGELRKKAEQAWESLPKSEREHRVGLFRKEENLSKKQQFILDFVHQHKSDEVLKQWNERHELLKQKLLNSNSEFESEISVTEDILKKN